MTVKVIEKGSKKRGKIVAQACCWWVTMAYLWQKA